MIERMRRAAIEMGLDESRAQAYADMIERMRRAAVLDITLYEEVEHDPSRGKEARLIVILVAAAGALSALLGGLFTGNFTGAVAGAIISGVVYFIGWYIWSYAVLQIGTKLFGGTADFGEVSRCIAYAYAPNLLRVFGFLPGVGGLLALIGSIWSLVAGIVAIRQAMDFGTGKAIFTAVFSWVILVVIISVITALLLVPMGIMAAG